MIMGFNYEILVEGETEKRLLESLEIVGKINLVNLWNVDINKRLRKFKPNTKVFVIYDTDIKQSQGNIQRFNDNLRVLDKHKFLGGILQQTLNFEDELVLACGKLNSTRDLFSSFHAVNAREFKTNFLKSNNRLEVLKQNDFDAAKLWQQATGNRYSNLVKLSFTACIF